FVECAAAQGKRHTRYVAVHPPAASWLAQRGNDHQAVLANSICLHGERAILPRAVEHLTGVPAAERDSYASGEDVLAFGDDTVLPLNDHRVRWVRAAQGGPVCVPIVERDLLSIGRVAPFKLSAAGVVADDG